MSSPEKRWSGIHKLLLPVANLIGMQLMAFTNDRQRVFFFEGFKNHLAFEVGGKLSFGFAFDTGLSLARYPTYQVVLNMGRTIMRPGKLVNLVVVWDWLKTPIQTGC